MKKLKTNYDDRIAAAKEAKQALLAKFKPKPTVQAEVLVTREEEKALERERVRQDRAEAKEAARLAALAPEREKLMAFAAALRALPVPDVTKADDIREQVEHFAKWVEDLIP